jgi:hypothetical protein
MHLSVQNIHSHPSGDFNSQVTSCLSQIQLYTINDKRKRRIVKMTVFSACEDNAGYILKRKLLTDILSKSEEYQAPVSLVSQPPLNGETIMEVWILDYTKPKYTFTFTHTELSSVLLVDGPDSCCLFSTHASTHHATFKENTFETFSQLDKFLQTNRFDYSDIVRQWNYMENIHSIDTVNNIPFQNYQIFNDVRSFFYEKSAFTKGYPSATGIGMDHGGCTIEVIAFKGKDTNIMRPVTNSYQIDAHSYSSTVLEGSAIEERKTVSTPKFERGKHMQFPDEGFLFISGTASIIGEKTVFPDDVAKQTLTTINNIEHLVSTKNLNNNNISIVSPPRLLNYRVYLKNASDYPLVQALCDDHYGTNKGFIVKADICRSNLLIEIEANYLV